MREVYIITDHRPLVAKLSKDVAMLSQLLQCILLQIKHFILHIMYKPVPDLYIAGRLSKNNHGESKDKEIEGIRVNMNAISNSINIHCIHLYKTYRQLNIMMCTFKN